MTALGAAVAVAVVATVGVTGGPAPAAIVAGVGAAGAWWMTAHCHRFPLRAMRARPVAEAQEPRLHAIVRELSARGRLPVPGIYVSPTDAVTALSAGRGPQRAVLCFTEGALQVLDDRELRAVVAHELAHIRHGDTLPGSVAGWVAARLWRVGFRGPLWRGAADVLRRVAATREREFGADIAAARLTGDPMAVAGALRTVHAAAATVAFPADADVLGYAHLMVVRPTVAYTTAGAGSTAARGATSAGHPPIDERVARLERLAGYRR